MNDMTNSEFLAASKATMPEAPAAPEAPDAAMASAAPAEPTKNAAPAPSELPEFFSFDLDEMLRDFFDFDPIEYRYGIRKAKSNFDREDPDWEQKIRNKIEVYRLAHTPLDRIDFDEHGMLENLRLIYGYNEPIEKYIKLYRMIQEKVIRDYLAIDGLARMFNPLYFNYEWEMHMRLNYDQHSQSFYRDHFIHQTKNAYEIMRFLIELPKLQDSIIKNLQKGEAVVGTFYSQYVDQEYMEIMSNPASSEIFAELYESKPLNTNDSDNPKEPPDEQITEENKKKTTDRRVDEKGVIGHISKNIVKSALIISALYHDIGYPIGHTLEGQEFLSSFIPTAHYFLGKTVEFSDIAGRLSASMLFQVVGKDRINAAFDERLHGTLSAIALLLHFYESGSIHKLRPAKRAAIELAALIMADHTNEYKLLDKKADDYYRAVNFRNPLSFLLRICDDIQEWGRIYFYVSTNETLRVCEKCKMPIVHCNFELDDSGTIAHPHTVRRHLCGCEIATGANNDPERAAIEHIKSELLSSGGERNYISISDVPYRKLNHVSYADRIRFYNIKQLKRERSFLLDFLPTYSNIENNPVMVNENEAFILHVDYNLYKLLQGSVIEPGFAHFRSEEIQKTKKLLSGNSGFPTVIIHSDVTTNPISLKVKILERFISNLCSRQDLAQLLISEYAQRCNAGNTDNLISEISKRFEARIAKDKKNNKDTKPSDRIDIICEVLSDRIYRYDCIPDKENNQLLTAIRIYMLLFSEIKYSVSEVETVLQRIEKKINDENKETAMPDEDANAARGEIIDSTICQNRIMALQNILSDESRYAARVGINRWQHNECAKRAFEGYIKYEDDGIAIDKLHDLYISMILRENKFRTPGVIERRLNDFFKQLLGNGAEASVIKSWFSSLCGEFSQIELKEPEEQTDGFSQRFPAHLEFYYRLLVISKLLITAKEFNRNNPTAESHINELRQILLAYILNDPLVSEFAKQNGDSLKILIDDFLQQENRHINYYEYAKNNSTLPDEYFSIYEQPGYIKEAIEQYIHSDNYKKFIFGSEDNLEMYSDLYLFFRLSMASQ